MAWTSNSQTRLLGLQQSVRHLAQEKIKPRARDIDTTGEYPQDLFDEFKKADLLGLCIPEEYGGSGAGILGLTLTIEEVTKYSNVLGLMLLLTRLAHRADHDRGQRGAEAALPARHRQGRAARGVLPLRAGRRFGRRGHADARDRGPRRRGGFILNGTKCWISGGMQADWFVVFAKTGDPSSRTHTDIGASSSTPTAPGVTRPRVDKKMGVKGIDTTEIVFNDVKVGPHQVIGGGFALAMQSLNAMRPIVAAAGIGLAEGALMYATEYVKSVEAFGKTIAEFQGIQWEIAKCATEIEAARLLTYRGAVAGRPRKLHQGVRPDALDVQVLRHRSRGEGLGTRGATPRRRGLHGGPPRRAVLPRRAPAHHRRRNEPGPARSHREGRLGHDLWWD